MNDGGRLPVRTVPVSPRGDRRLDRLPPQPVEPCVGQRVVKAGAEIDGERRELGEHFDRGVDGPVHSAQG